VVGTIDIEAALRTGSKRFEPGVLAEANRNILYVDEVNLLDDHIVDVLLDAAAMESTSSSAKASRSRTRPASSSSHHEPRRGRTKTAAARPLRPVRRRRGHSRP